MRKFLIISFFSIKVLGFESERFLFEVFAGYFTPWIRIFHPLDPDISPLGSGYFTPWIRTRGFANFADLDFGSQNVADPTDPDPKH